MTKLPLLLSTILTMAISFAGCRSTAEKTREEQRDQWEDRVSRQVLEMDGKIFNLQNQIAVLRQQLETLEKLTAGLGAEIKSGEEMQKKESAELRREIAATRAAIDKKMEIILEEIARENERLLDRIRQSRSSAVMQGYEHVVKPGETLSQIASQYNTTIQAVVEANQLSDPNSLRVGQKLFIPQ